MRQRDYQDFIQTMFRYFTRASSLAACLLVIFSTFLPLATVHAQEIETWMDISKDVTVANGEILSYDKYDSLLRSKFSLKSASTCTNKSLPYNVVEVDGNTSYEYRSDCWHDTNIGYLSQTGYFIQPKDMELAGSINNFAPRLFPTSNQDVFVEITEHPVDNSSYAFNFHTSDSIEFELQDTPGGFPTSYKIASEPAFTLTASDHSYWPVSDNQIYSQIWYSGNGKWMILWDTRGFLSRINLQTFDVLTIDAMVAGSEGNDYHASVAATNDGRYIAVNPYGHPLRIIDTATCADKTAPTITEPTIDCSTRFLSNELSQAGVYGGYGNLPQFYDNGVLGFYVAHSSEDYWEYLLLPPNTVGTDYIALGDSFASGEGAHSYEQGTDIKDVNLCHLSTVSYPYLLYTQLWLDSMHSVACSGAKMVNVIGGTGIDVDLEDTNRDNQYYDEDFKPAESWHPGYMRQLDHFNKLQPDIITISMIGNDIGFADKLTYCIAATDDCFSSYEDRLEIVREINNKFDSLVDMYRQLKNASIGSRVYVIGYPQIVNIDRDAKCAVNTPLSSSERELTNYLTNYLNTVIKSAAAKAGVAYVGIEGSLNGYLLCEGTKNNVAINGITAGRDNFIIGNESFHPNGFGHELMAKAIREQTNDFTLAMPRPDPTSSPPSEIGLLMLRDAPKTNRSLNKLNYDDNSSNNVAYFKRNVHTSIHFDNLKFDLAKSEAFNLVLYSEPVQLGTFTSDSMGNLSVDFTTPETVPPGLHALHLFGKNQAGENIDIYRYVYVAVSDNDWDGDGIPNNQEPCGVIDPSGLDEDKDGIDDACDPIIGEVPFASTPNASPNEALWSKSQPPTAAASSSSTPTKSISVPAFGAAAITPSEITSMLPKQPAKQDSQHKHDSSRTPLILSMAAVFAIALTFLGVVRYAKSQKA